MLSPSLTEKVAHGQTGVAAADDDRLNVLYVSSHKPAPLFHESLCVVNTPSTELTGKARVAGRGEIYCRASRTIPR